jgi:hypothetical protein
MRSALLAAAAAACLVATAARAEEPSAAAPARAPDATITFRGRTATIGVGFVWGASTLEFQGKTYPVRADGFVLGAAGTASLEGVGQVYGLTKAEDLNGDFTALASGGAFGRGAGTLVMRNDKGVRIVMDLKASGLQLGIGPRGITLSVGEAGGAPADASTRLPQTLGFGELKAGPLFLRPTLNAQIYFAASHNAGFDGDWSFGPVDEIDQTWSTRAHKEVDALDHPHRGRSGGRHSGRACCRDHRAAEGLGEVERNPADALLADHSVAGRHCLVAGSASSGGSFGLGVVLPVVGMPARC